MSHEVESMFSVKQVPWHGLGNILQEHPNSRQALEASGLDWKVEGRPVFWQNGTGIKQIMNRQALVRIITDNCASLKDNQDIIPNREDLLSIVSDRYRILQNQEAFSIFDPMVESGELVYETAGSLMSGRKVWILARLANAEIAVHGEDKIRPYLLLLNGHDGETAVTVQPTPVRVVCNNTLMMSLSYGETISFNHQGDIVQRVEEAISTIRKMHECAKEMGETYARFCDTHLDPFDRHDIIVRTLAPHISVPMEEDGEDTMGIGNMTKRQARFVEEAEDKILFLLQHGQGGVSTYGWIQDTVWGTYNALIEFAEYYLGRRARDMGAYQLLGEGSRFKLRALSECMQFCARVEQAVKIPPPAMDQ